MITAGERLRRLEAEYLGAAYAAMSYEESLARFAALWAEARELDPGFTQGWLADLEPDLAVARAVNGLPPAA